MTALLLVIYPYNTCLYRDTFEMYNIVVFHLAE